MKKGGFGNLIGFHCSSSTVATPCKKRRVITIVIFITILVLLLTIILIQEKGQVSKVASLCEQQEMREKGLGIKIILIFLIILLTILLLII